MPLTVALSQTKMLECLQADPRYRAYSVHIGDVIKREAIAIFIIRNKKTNELRTSEVTPPKYLASFRVDYHKATLRTYVTNTDPGWALVEFGSHPGGNPNAHVPAYKPLRRALIAVSVRKRD